jgi:hypothetical protein
MDERPSVVSRKRSRRAFFGMSAMAAGAAGVLGGSGTSEWAASPPRGSPGARTKIPLKIAGYAYDRVEDLFHPSTLTLSDPL